MSMKSFLEGMSGGQKTAVLIIAIIMIGAVANNLFEVFKEPEPVPVFKDAMAERIYAASRVNSFASDAEDIVRRAIEETCPCLNKENKKDE